MWRVWEDVLPQVRSRHAPQDSHGGKALQVQRVWEGLFPEDTPAEAPEHAHRGEAPHLRPVWESLLSQVRSHQAPADSHWGEAPRVCPVWESFPHEVLPPRTSEDAHRRATLRVRQVWEGLSPQVTPQQSPEDSPWGCLAGQRPAMFAAESPICPLGPDRPAQPTPTLPTVGGACSCTCPVQCRHDRPVLPGQMTPCVSVALPEFLSPVIPREALRTLVREGDCDQDRSPLKRSASIYPSQEWEVNSSSVEPVFVCYVCIMTHGHTFTVQAY